jgi:hypothetical protein
MADGEPSRRHIRRMRARAASRLTLCACIVCPPACPSLCSAFAFPFAGVLPSVRLSCPSVVRGGAAAREAAGQGRAVHSPPRPLSPSHAQHNSRTRSHRAHRGPSGALGCLLGPSRWRRSFLLVAGAVCRQQNRGAGGENTQDKECAQWCKWPWNSVIAMRAVAGQPLGLCVVCCWLGWG